MTQTRWAVDGPDGTSLEVDGHMYTSNDEGAPVLCTCVCSSMGRHVHIDYCRTEGTGCCDGAEVQHINERISPNPNKPKDAITHSLHWRRMGTLTTLLLRQVELKHYLQASKVPDLLLSPSRTVTEFYD